MNFGGSFRRLASTALIVGSLFAGGGAVANGQAATGRKPNIIFIMGDDIGWANIGVYNQGIMAGPDAKPGSTAEGRTGQEDGVTRQSVEFPAKVGGANQRGRGTGKVQA